VKAPDYVRDDWEGIHDTTKTYLGGDRLVLRRNARRPASKRNKAQNDAMVALGYVARYWKETLTAAQRLAWGTAGDVLQLRDGENRAKWAFCRFVQVQMGLQLWDHGLEETYQKRLAYSVRSLAIVEARTNLQLVRLGWEWERNDTNQQRLAFFVSQVPPGYIEQPSAWKYAVLMGSNNYNLTLTNPGWQSESAWFALKFPAKAGDTVQLFVRIDTFNNTAPPGTKQTSHLTTEDWQPLTIVMP